MGVTYRQLNKDYAFWTEKRRLGYMKGGQLSGLVTVMEDGVVRQRVLIDVGLGTMESIADHLPDSFWDDPLVIFITHGHIDHHAELMILSEMYCQRRGPHWRVVRPPVAVYATPGTFAHLDRTHWWGYRGGDTLRHIPLTPNEGVVLGPLTITGVPVEHFLDSVNFLIEFELTRPHKILIGWDMTRPPLAELDRLRAPSLAFFDATTWNEPDVGHVTITSLMDSGYLPGLALTYDPPAQRYGGYLLHYSGWEDEEGILSDEHLKAKFDRAYPEMAPLIRVAARGQEWRFS